MSSHAGDLSRGRGHGRIRNRTPLPTGDPWRLPDGSRVGPVEVLQEGWVRKVGAGDPRAVLRPVTHPVHQVVKPPPAAMDGKDPVDLPVMFWGDTMEPDHMGDEQVHRFSRGREFRQGDEVNHLREPVDHGQNGVVALGGREAGDKVKGNVRL